MDRESIEKALSKPALYGPDIDLSKYRLDEPSMGELNEKELESIDNVLDKLGFQKTPLSYVQIDESARYRIMEKFLSKYGAKIMPLRKALDEIDLAKKISWKIIKPDTDKYTASTYLHGGEIGYFIYVPPHTRIPIPIYTCLAIIGEKKIQFAHNVVYVDEGGEAHLVTGCAVPHGVREGIHIGISEFYVARNARLTYTMIHAWAEGLHVRPRTGVYVEESGEYVSYYVVYSPIASLQTYPKVYLSKNSRAYLASITAASGSGIYDLGAKTILGENNSSSEIISRVVARDNSQVYARADIEAHSSNTRGHIECLGLLLSDNAIVSSIPIITSKKPGALLSHEAAIGMIAEKELVYLMSKGFTEEEARAILIRGFMNVEAPSIPKNIRAEINRILDLVSKYAVG
ncbi:MAG: SufBD protein [Desulfurococcales archaeon ex4484_58]|nr:MAG: SufBD protein [Desulfurococcales archaeon ex4484_58]